MQWKLISIRLDHFALGLCSRGAVITAAIGENYPQQRDFPVFKFTNVLYNVE